jgi:hypothetical protein
MGFFHFLYKKKEGEFGEFADAGREIYRRDNTVERR